MLAENRSNQDMRKALYSRLYENPIYIDSIEALMQSLTLANAPGLKSDNIVTYII